MSRNRLYLTPDDGTLASVRTLAAADGVTPSTWGLAAVRREVRRRTPVRAVPDLCAYRDEAMVRCLHTAEIGGFCFVHDELIHQLGGDNHPATRDIFARSTLGTTRPPVERGEES